MDENSSPPSFLADVLRSAFGRRQGWERRFVRTKIWEAWEEIVGTHVAAHAWPDSFTERDTLVVVVSDSVWMQQLHFQRGILIERLNARLGEAGVKDIRFSLGHVDEVRELWRKPKRRGGSGVTADADGPLPAEVMGEAEALVTGLEDEGLKGIFRRLYIKDRKRAARCGPTRGGAGRSL